MNIEKFSVGLHTSTNSEIAHAEKNALLSLLKQKTFLNN